MLRYSSVDQESKQTLPFLSVLAFQGRDWSGRLVDFRAQMLPTLSLEQHESVHRNTFVTASSCFQNRDGGAKMSQSLLLSWVPKWMNSFATQEPNNLPKGGSSSPGDCSRLRDAWRKEACQQWLKVGDNKQLPALPFQLWNTQELAFSKNS